MSRKSIINAVSLLGILILGYIFFIFLKSFKQPPNVALPQKGTRMVQVDSVKYDALPGTLETSGRIVAFDEIAISSEVTGRLTAGAHPFKAGSSFKKGELIARVENEEFAYQLKAQRSRFMQSLAAALADVKIDFPESYDRWFAFFQTIKSDDTLPDLPEITSAKERIFLAGRNILNDYYTIKGNEVRMEKHLIVAPYNGTLKEVNTQIGSVVGVNTRLATFTRTDLFELEVPVSFENSGIVKPGLKVAIRNKDGEHHWTGTVNRVANVVNPATQSVSVYISIPGSSAHPLFDGMYLSATVDGESIPHVFGIPRDAIFNDHFVHILENKKLVRQPVEKVFFNKETTYIKGLSEGAAVVTEPIMGITDYLEFEPINN